MLLCSGLSKESIANATTESKKKQTALRTAQFVPGVRRKGRPARANARRVAAAPLEILVSFANSLRKPSTTASLSSVHLVPPAPPFQGRRRHRHENPHPVAMGRTRHARAFPSPAILKASLASAWVSLASKLEPAAFG